ncbi:MAG: cupin domain-containing protein [Planctomycetes bacterium]|nr:cupin domain-containing protein [Planctomycetota bacterium]
MKSEQVVVPRVVDAGKGVRHLSPGGDVTVPKLNSGESGGTFQAVELEVVPGGGPPLHVHDREDEAFYVVDGEVHFWLCESGDRTGKTGRPVVLSKGAFAFGPRGTAHTFRNRGSTLARMFLIVNPGANFEAFFDKIGAPGPDGAMPSPAEVIARTGKFAPEHGITILGPNPL